MVRIEFKSKSRLERKPRHWVEHVSTRAEAETRVQTVLAYSALSPAVAVTAKIIDEEN